MQSRINTPAMTIPGAMEALQKLGAAARRAGVPATTRYLIEVPPARPTAAACAWTCTRAS
jgi:hypothetical protein